MPVFIEHADRLVSWYDRTFIAAAHKRFAQLPPLTQQQSEALDAADALCSDAQV